MSKKVGIPLLLILVVTLEKNTNSMGSFKANHSEPTVTRDDIFHGKELLHLMSSNSE